MPDFNNDPSFRGEGRENPPPRPRLNPGQDGLAHLNFARGTRIKVLKDNNKRGLLGLEGVVVQSFPGYVVVELESDPALRHRVSMQTGFAKSRITPRRHFRVTEVERLV